MVIAYALVSVLSAFLVFFIQPVVAKIALPALGGVPAVWNGCMLFFQLVLLCGYLYANVLSNQVRVRFQPWVHIVLLLAATLVFPMGFSGLQGIAPNVQPMLWLACMLLFSVGLPFFAISATAPLLQRWFSHTDHKDAANPYFLYAASNIGSMSALLLYPVGVEPFLKLMEQVHIWENGVRLLAGLFVVAGVYLMRREVSSVEVEPVVHGLDVPQHEEAISWAQRGKWVFYSAIPASMLYGLTTYLTTDIAPFPFLWVLPLALYLITFICVFATRPMGVELAQKIHLPFVGALAMLVGSNFTGIPVLGFHVAGFFMIVLSVHGYLAQSKPTARHLTEFFLWMSLGGVLGGAFNTFAAPYLFTSVAEYPLALVLSCLVGMRGARVWEEALRYKKAVLLVVVIVFLWLHVVPVVLDAMIAPATRLSDGSPEYKIALINILLQAFVIFVAWERYRNHRIIYALFIGAVVFVTQHGGIKFSNNQVLLRERSIFGVHRVVLDPVKHITSLYHGTTFHALQSTNPAFRLMPKGYYSHIAPAIRHYQNQSRPIRLAVLGLGAGTLVCHGREEDRVDVFEIDPVVYSIASNPAYFTYMRDCPPSKKVFIGDGRMELAKRPDAQYDVIMMDAFSSDAIPVHLITREAILTYMQKLKPDGVLLLHVSNRYIDLRYALSSVAHSLKLPVASQMFYPELDDKLSWPAQWVAITKNTPAMQPLLETDWKPLEFYQERYVWTDDYSNVMTSLRVAEKWLGLHLESDASP